MKKILCSFLLLGAFAPCAIAQNDTPSVPSTKLETFLSKKGLLLIRDFYVPGRIVRYGEGKADSIKVFANYDEMYAVTSFHYNTYAEVTAVTAYEPGKETAKTKGLNIDVVEVARNGNDSTSTLDLEEAESLSSALDYLVKLSDKWKGQDVGSKEAYFVTKDDLKIAIDQEGTKPPKFFLISGRIGSARMTLLNAENLTGLKTLVDQGVEWLKKQ
jgi:hypothetical protein